MGAELAETLELREEQLVAHKELQEVGEILVRTPIEEVPGRLEVGLRLSSWYGVLHRRMGCEASVTSSRARLARE
jgi:hypothetical protein